MDDDDDDDDTSDDDDDDTSDDDVDWSVALDGSDCTRSSWPAI